MLGKFICCFTLELVLFFVQFASDAFRSSSFGPQFFSSLFFFVRVCALSFFLLLPFSSVLNQYNKREHSEIVLIMNVDIAMCVYSMWQFLFCCTWFRISSFTGNSDDVVGISFNNREIFSSVFANFALDGNDSSILWSFIADGNIKIQCMSCHFQCSFLRIDIWHVSPKSLIITKKSIESTSSEIFDVIIWKMF